MPDLPDEIARINALTTNARNTWFALLGVLVFVGITLMGVEHIDFYGVDRATKLPLVDVDVPTRYFFVAAPLLTAAIYGYFHLYLIRLWDALGAAQSRISGARLGDVIAPWLITDAALQIRRAFRKDNCATPRTLETVATGLNILLAWGFGLVVLYLLWTVSFAARSFWMSGIAGVAFGLSVIAGFTSLMMMLDRMWAEPTGKPPYPWSKPSQSITTLAAIAFIIFQSHQRTEGPETKLAPLSLNGESIVQRPPGWLSYLIARKDFLTDWCGREQIADCGALSKQQETEFRSEWYERREAIRKDLAQPDWNPAPLYGELPEDSPPLLDLRHADLRGTFLVATNLALADLRSANLSLADLESANLSNANLTEANLSSARLHETVFLESEMPQARLVEVRASYGTFWQSNLTGAELRSGTFSHATFFQANLTGADFSRAMLYETDFAFADLSMARLDFSYHAADRQTASLLQYTTLNGAVNNGGALRNIDASGIRYDAATDFRNVFLDGSVTLPKEFRAQMGDPCQWADDVLSDQEFFARWRWWVEANPERDLFESWSRVAPPGWREVQAWVPDGLECRWQTGPMLGDG